MSSPSTVALLSGLGARLIHLYGPARSGAPAASGHASGISRLVWRAARNASVWRRHSPRSRQRERLLRELDALRAHQDERRDLLAFQLDELTGAGVESGEQERLRLERERLRHAERLQQVCNTAEAALYSDDGAIIATLARLGSQLREATAIDPDLAAPGALQMPSSMG
jgi:DNA repair protein RecN (Recombination protein N)